MFIRKELSNGIRIVVEKLPEIRSVTLGIWINAGSVFENYENNGISHFIEHMMFKGTTKRTYKQIAEEMDNIGGQLNAFTAKECTCYYSKVIDEKQGVAVDLLSDMLVNSIFSENEIAKEKGVVIEEILMNEDDPEDVAHENLTVNFFKGTELSKTILGPEKNIKNLTRSDIIDYLKNNYTAENIVVVAVGNVDIDAMVNDFELKLGTINRGIKRNVVIVDKKWEPKKETIKIKKDTEQINICMGLPGYAYHDKRKYAMSIISNVFGGSMSSRLFQKIREEAGAAYSVYSYPSVYTGAGMFSIYAGTSPQKANFVIDAIMNEISGFKMTETELENTKAQMKGSFILSQESMSAKMNAIGKSMLLKNAYMTEEEILSLISAITMDDITEACNHIFNMDKLTTVCVGNI